MKWKEFNWSAGSLLILYHLALFITLPLYLMTRTPSRGLLLTTFILVYLVGMGISSGYHRFYAHKAYKLNKFVEFIILLFGTLSVENSAIKWSHDHRNHHKYVDTERDPYNIKKGFWHAHILWIINKREKFDPEVVKDLYNNKLAILQHKCYMFLLFFLNICIWVIVGYAFNDYYGAVVFAVLLRIFIVHHSTFFINSLAHMWGEKTYTKESTAVDNYLLAFLTYGEGYHNYHHAFATDYRNGIKWYHYDPTKWLIWVLNKLGLAKEVKHINKYTADQKLILEDKNMLLETIKNTVIDKKEVLEKNIYELSEQMITKINEIKSHSAQLDTLKKEKEHNKIKDRKMEIKILKRSIHSDKKSWNNLCEKILSIQKSNQRKWYRIPA